MGTSGSALCTICASATVTWHACGMAAGSTQLPLRRLPGGAIPEAISMATFKDRMLDAYDTPRDAFANLDAGPLDLDAALD